MNKTNGKVNLLCLAMLFLVGCGVQETVILEEQVMMSEEDELLYITENDQNTEHKNPVYINLSEVEDAYLIDSGGDYILYGESNHALTIDVHDEMVHLFLDDVNIETFVGPAINIVSGSKVIVTLLEGSTNTLLDAAYYGNQEVTGAISSVCDLTINGEGTLYVCGYYKDAIYTKDVFKLVGGNVRLQAKRCGIKGNDGIVLQPDSLEIESEKNGCQTSNQNKTGKGIIDMRDGEVTIIAGEYGMSAVSDVYIRGGELYINSVIADFDTEGQQYIEEGAVIYE